MEGRGFCQATPEVAQTGVPPTDRRSRLSTRFKAEIAKPQAAILSRLDRFAAPSKITRLFPAAVAELADALDSGSSVARRAGSTPVGRNEAESPVDARLRGFLLRGPLCGGPHSLNPYGVRRSLVVDHDRRGRRRVALPGQSSGDDVVAFHVRDELDRQRAGRRSRTGLGLVPRHG